MYKKIKTVKNNSRDTFLVLTKPKEHYKTEKKNIPKIEDIKLNNIGYNSKNNI